MTDSISFSSPAQAQAFKESYKQAYKEAYKASYKQAYKEAYLKEVKALAYEQAKAKYMQAQVSPIKPLSSWDMFVGDMEVYGSLVLGSFAALTTHYLWPLANPFVLPASFLVGGVMGLSMFGGKSYPEVSHQLDTDDTQAKHSDESDSVSVKPAFTPKYDKSLAKVDEPSSTNQSKVTAKPKLLF